MPWRARDKLLQMTETAKFFDEMRDPDGAPHPPYAKYDAWFSAEDKARIRRKATEAEEVFRRTGITFNVYGDPDAGERLIPFDVIPRIIGGGEWVKVTRGIEQRVRAINAFLHDMYHRREILRAGRIPAELFHHNVALLPEMMGVSPAGGGYTHIVGVDIVRTGPDAFFALEDNVRTPSGVSYMLENRETA